MDMENYTLRSSVESFVLKGNILVKSKIEEYPWKSEYKSILIQALKQKEFRGHENNPNELALCWELEKIGLLTNNHNLYYIGYKITDNGIKVLNLCNKI